MSLWYDIVIDRHTAESGMLSVLEYPETIPFPVKRVFWVSNVATNTIRGAHAHAELEQVLFCTNGSCVIEVTDTSGNTAAITLSENGAALYLPGAVWRSMRDFTPGCSLIVLCDRPYSEDQVIRSFDQFVKLP